MKVTYISAGEWFCNNINCEGLVVTVAEADAKSEQYAWTLDVQSGEPIPHCLKCDELMIYRKYD